MVVVISMLMYNQLAWLWISLNRDPNIFFAGTCLNSIIIPTVILPRESLVLGFDWKRGLAAKISSRVIPMLTSTVPTVAWVTALQWLCVCVCEKCMIALLGCVSTDRSRYWQWCYRSKGPLSNCRLSKLISFPDFPNPVMLIVGK